MLRGVPVRIADESPTAESLFFQPKIPKTDKMGVNDSFEKVFLDTVFFCVRVFASTLEVRLTGAASKCPIPLRVFKSLKET